MRRGRERKSSTNGREELGKKRVFFVRDLLSIIFFFHFVNFRNRLKLTDGTYQGQTASSPGKLRSIMQSLKNKINYAIGIENRINSIIISMMYIYLLQVTSSCSSYGA